MRSLILLLTVVWLAQPQGPDPDHQLLDAAVNHRTSGASELIADLLTKGAHVDAHDPDSGDTPLMRAALSGNGEFLKALIARGADINARNKAGFTALFRACSTPQGRELLTELLTAHADLNARTNNGVTVLTYAVQLGDLRTIQTLLAAGAQVNVRADDGSTAVNAAARIHRPDIIEILRKSGAEVRHATPVPTDELVQLSRLTRRIDPEYPAGNADAHTDVPVKFEGLIGRDGAVLQLTYVSGLQSLEEPARKAAMQWRYDPVVLDDEYVEARTTLSVAFPRSTAGTEFDAGMAPIAKDVAQAKAMNIRKDGMPVLEKAVRSCSSARPPNNACADAYDWYGMALQNDTKQETLLKAEPFYLKGLELRVRSPHSLASMALSLELEGLALEGLFQAQRGHEMRDRAHELRALNVKAMDTAAQTGAMVAGTNTTGPTYRVGGGVAQPVVTYKVDPQYADEARAVRYSGSVMLSVIVDTQGRARNIQLLSSLGLGLDERAVAAVQSWVFKPGMKDGHPVNVRAQVQVNFKLL